MYVLVLSLNSNCFSSVVSAFDVKYVCSLYVVRPFYFECLFFSWVRYFLEASLIFESINCLKVLFFIIEISDSLKSISYSIKSSQTLSHQSFFSGRICWALSACTRFQVFAELSNRIEDDAQRWWNAMEARQFQDNML